MENYHIDRHLQGIWLDCFKKRESEKALCDAHLLGTNTYPAIQM